MKKHLLFLSVLLLSLVGAFAQNSGTGSRDTLWRDIAALNDNYYVEFRAKHANCYDNGEVEFRIVNRTTGRSVTSADSAILHLDTVLRIYHKGNDMDQSWHSTDVPGGYDYSQEWMSVHMDVGTFQIKMQCVYKPDGLIEHNLSVIDTTTVTINNVYQEPYIFAVVNPSYDRIREGNLPSLDCANTGMIQLRIDGNAFPFHVIRKYNGEFLDTLHFYNYINSTTNTDSNYANFYKYFDVENLEPGEWDFKLIDGCNSGTLYTGQIVNTIPIPKLERLQLYAFSGNKYDVNIFKVRVKLNTRYSYYIKMFAPYMEYCFYDDRFQPYDEATSWHPFPAQSGDSLITLADTVLNARSYCDLRGHDFTFKFRVKETAAFQAAFPGCSGWDTTITFQLRTPDAYKSDNGMELYDQVLSTDPCSDGTYYYYKDHFRSWYKAYDANHLSDVDTGEVTCYRYHFTYPLIWEYRDAVGGDLIKADTIYSDFVGEKSTLSLSDFQQLPQFSDAQPGFERTVTRILREMNISGDIPDCFLSNQTITYKFETIVDNASGPMWVTSRKSPECCSQMREIVVQEKYGVDEMNHDGIVVELFASPENNFYNFRAVYNASRMEWDITKDQENNYTLVEGDAHGQKITMSDNCLPSGYYQFRISNAPCGADTVVYAYLSGIVSMGLSEEPEYEIRETCNAKYVKFTKGTVSKFTDVIRENANRSNARPVRETTNLTTRFKIIDGPVGGYDYMSNQVYKKNDSIRISFPTTPETPYKVRIYPELNGQNICGSYADTFDIFFEGKSLSFDFASALLCSEDDTVGTAYVKAKYGIAPYTFTLYPEPDLQGEPLGVLTVPHEDSIAVFADKKFNSQSYLSCEVIDYCGQSFSMNFPPFLLSELQMAWFDPSVSHTCEGDSVKICALQIGMIFDYTWIGPAPDYDTISRTPSPTIFIPRGSEPGEYTVIIHQSGCQSDFFSSVYLNPEPSPGVGLTFASDNEVCPGEPVAVKFVPYLSDASQQEANNARITFKVAFEDLTGITYRTYYNKKHNETIIDTFVAYSNTKIYPVHIEETIGECTYDRADPGDTLRINIDTNRINPCQILTKDALVCSGNDTLLLAKCTVSPPYTIRWYTDYEQTDLVASQTISNTNDWSVYDLPGLTQRIVRYVSVVRDGMCPSTNSAPNGVVVMEDGGITEVRCSSEYLFYDEGGRDGDYEGVSGHESHTHLFYSQNHTVAVHIESLNLSETAHLAFYNGSRPIRDSLICVLGAGYTLPDIISSTCDTLLVYFSPGQLPGEGWSATVKPTPGIAIGDVIPTAYEQHSDVVCQSQTNQYINEDIINLGIATQEELNLAVKHAATYHFETDPGLTSVVTGCDSVAKLTLKVTPAPVTETFAVTTNQTGYWWHGQRYITPGQHVFTIPDDNNCDSYDILNLIVIEVSNPDRDFCDDIDSLILGVYLTTYDSVLPTSSLVEERHSIGDVLCIDGNRYRPVRFDSLASHPELKPIGVVFYMEGNNVNGKAISLRDVSIDGEAGLCWALGKEESKSVHAATSAGPNNYEVARNDMNGMSNTNKIKSTAGGDDREKFKKNAPAAYACYFYDPITMSNDDTPHGWYLPATGEWNLYYAFRQIVNETLAKMVAYGATVPKAPDSFTGNAEDFGYWTSTEVDATRAWHINAKGQLHYNHLKTRADKRTRAIISF